MISAESFGYLPSEAISLILGGHKIKEFPPFNINRDKDIRKQIKYFNREYKEIKLIF